MLVGVVEAVVPVPVLVVEPEVDAAEATWVLDALDALALTAAVVEPLPPAL